MGSTLSFEYKDATPTLQLIAGTVFAELILSPTIDIVKTVQQIALENNPPVSSTYNKKLHW
jgi:hypothetical protein